MKEKAGSPKKIQTTSIFRSEAEIVAAMARVAATLPKEIRDVLSFGNGETQVLQVIGADTRRNDAIFHSCKLFYGAEFKKGMLLESHIYESIIRRQYPQTLKAKFGNELGGFIFVAEQIQKEFSSFPIMKEWEKLVGVKMAVADTKEFARILISKAMKDVQSDTTRFTPYALCQIPLQLHALTTKSDGYPQWFDEEWLQRMMSKFFPICQ
jgi:hypothetical protein